MYATGVLFRTMTDEVKRFNLTWYNELEKHTNRDQLSIGYAAELHGLKINRFHPTVWNNTFKLWKHLARR